MARDFKFEMTEDSKIVASGVCTVTGNPYSVAITTDQFSEWRSGSMIQDVCPELSADQREFLISHQTPEEFEALFAEEQ